jgi:hypothetical protein
VVVDLRRGALLVVALAAVVFGAVLGRFGECNLVAVTSDQMVTTLMGCGQAPSSWAPLSLVVAATCVAAACLRRPGDSTDRRVRRRVTIGLVAVAVVVTTVLFALLRPGYAEIMDSGSFLCHRPVQDLGGPEGDFYTAGCRELAERRVLLSGASVAALLVLAVVGRVRRDRPHQTPPPVTPASSPTQPARPR